MIRPSSDLVTGASQQLGHVCGTPCGTSECNSISHGTLQETLENIVIWAELRYIATVVSVHRVQIISLTLSYLLTYNRYTVHTVIGKKQRGCLQPTKTY